MPKALSAHIRFGPTRSASLPSGIAQQKLTTPAMVRPRPTCAAVRPTTWVKKTALPVMNAPSPVAKSTDWTDSLRASGVGGRKRSRREGTTVIPSRTTRVGRVNTAVRALGDWLAADDPDPWVVETSGSTGEPKRVLLSRAAVLASVHASARRLGGSGRWLLALPASYVAGVQVICRSLVAGHEPVLLEEHESFAEASRGADYVSLVPTQLHRLLETDTEALRGFRTVLLGGGPIDVALRARAADAGVRVVATYGSAETAGGCVYDGYALDGVAVAIGEQGRIRIAGPTLFDGYAGAPHLTAEVLVDGWFLTS